MTTARSRYYIDDQGREWFAIGDVYDLTDEYGIFHGGDHICRFEKMYIPRDSVQITDALACSRGDLGPVYVVPTIVNVVNATPEKLFAIDEEGSVITDKCYWLPKYRSQFRLATLAEIQEADIE